MPQFIPGWKLSSYFYHEAVRPLLDEYFSNIPYAAALIGTGSEVFGFDTEMSTDHGWGPTVFILLRDEDTALDEGIYEVMYHYLPCVFYGYPVRSIGTTNPAGSRLTSIMQKYPMRHRVFSMSLRSFFWLHLAYDIDCPLDVADWLTFPSQRLRSVTEGVVHHDSVGELTRLREQLTRYPHDIWLYLLAAGWQRISNEEHFMARAGSVGDELGSAVIGSRLVRDIMCLCFLMEKQYAPYPKWLGTAFKQLASAKALLPILWHVQSSQIWQEREVALCKAYEYIACAHNALGITEKMVETVSDFYHRPFKVIHGNIFAETILSKITDDKVKRIALRPLIGSIDHISDNSDIRSESCWRHVLQKLYI